MRFLWRKKSEKDRDHRGHTWDLIVSPETTKGIVRP
jgi:hypothetical protein